MKIFNEHVFARIQKKINLMKVSAYLSNKQFTSFIIGAGLIIVTLMSCKDQKEAEKTQLMADDLPRISGQITPTLALPPEVGSLITRTHNTKVILNIEVIEKVMQMTDGVDYTYWTFGGTVPGPFIRIKQGDLVELHLHNNENNKMPHNIDLHAVTGPGGGAASTFTAPGHETVFSFTAINSGLYVYHCATAPVGMHVANGMYGLIMVEPKKNLPQVDKEFYVMQGDFYTVGGYGEAGLQPFDMNKALKEDADYVVFNGSVGSLKDDKALHANVGDKVRIFIGNGGPNLTSSFHVIGEIFDNVYVEGGSTINHNVQTTVVPPGGAAIVEFTVQVPGDYILVDHALMRAFNKGAIGFLKVAGDPNLIVYSGQQSEGIYQSEGGIVQNLPIEVKPAEPIVELTKSEKLKIGATLYTNYCQSCHQVGGKGVAGAFPPLAKSDFLNADPLRAINIVMKGKSGEVVVNGQKYNGVMPSVDFDDKNIASVITYILNSWGNNGGEITVTQVAEKRSGK